MAGLVAVAIDDLHRPASSYTLRHRTYPFRRVVGPGPFVLVWLLTGTEAKNLFARACVVIEARAAMIGTKGHGCICSRAWQGKLCRVSVACLHRLTGCDWKVRDVW